MTSDRGDHNEDVGVGFIENGGTDKKIWSKEIWLWNKFRNLKIKKIDVTGSPDRWKQDETIGAGFI